VYDWVKRDPRGDKRKKRGPLNEGLNLSLTTSRKGNFVYSSGENTQEHFLGGKKRTQVLLALLPEGKRIISPEPWEASQEGLLA